MTWHWASMRQLCPPIWSTLASTMHQPYRPQRPRRPRRWASGHMLRKRWRSKGSCTSSSAEELGIPRSVKVSTYFIFLHVSTASNTRKRSCEVLILNLFFVRSPPDDCFLQLSELQAWHNGKAKASQEHHSTLATAESETSHDFAVAAYWTPLDLSPMNQSASICINRLISTRYWYWEWDVSGNRRMLIARNLHHCHEWSITAKVP